MNEGWAKDILCARLLICTKRVEELIIELNEVEKDQLISANEKLLIAKKIRVEMKKITKELDSIKQVVILTETYKTN
jgi:hypothetical protein